MKAGEALGKYGLVRKPLLCLVVMIKEHASDAQLASFRRSIDNIDAALIHMLAERFRITKAVGEYKASAALPPADPDREERQVQRLRTLAIEAELDPEFSEKFLRFIIEEVIRHHEKARG